MRLTIHAILLTLLVFQTLLGLARKDEVISRLSLKDNEFVLSFFGSDVNAPAVIVTRLGDNAGKQQEYFVVFRGVYAGPFASLKDIPGRVVISPVTGSMAYVKKIADRYHVVVDGKQEGPYWLMDGNLHFSADGRSLLYAAKQDRQWFLFCGGEKTRPFDRISNFTVSPDGRAHVFIGEIQGKKYVVGQQRQFGPFGNIECGPVFSPDGTTIAFAVDENSKKVIYLGTPQMEFRRALDNGAEMIDSGSLVISSDNLTVGYFAAYNSNYIYINHMYVVKNDEKLGPFRNLLGKPWISPDGKTISCVVEGEDKQIRVMGPLGVYGPYQKADILCSSPDGTRFAYRAMFKDQWLCFVDGELFAKLGGLPDSLPEIMFSPNGKKIAHATTNKGKWYATVDDASTGPYDRVGPMAFSPDGKALAFLALSGKSIVRKVIALK